MKPPSRTALFPVSHAISGISRVVEFSGGAAVDAGQLADLMRASQTEAETPMSTFRKTGLPTSFEKVLAAEAAAADADAAV
jgi:hypothetical protein